MLYDRDVSLVIGKSGGDGRELRGLRIKFSIQKGSTKSPNKCSVSIWNMNDDTRRLVEVIGNVLILKAGYLQDSGAVQLFAGDVTRALTRREGPDWVTELELMDGHGEFRDSKVTISLDKGVTTDVVIDNLAKEFSLPVRPLPDDVTPRQYPNGFCFVGKVRDGLDKACQYAGLEWSIQNREIQIIKKGGHIKQLAVVLSPDSGMIGSPEAESKTMTDKEAAKDGYTAGQKGVQKTWERNDKGEIENKLLVTGYRVKSLLQPLIEPGGYVQVFSRALDGEFFRVEEVSHEGDTHGPDWFTTATLRYPK